MQLVTSKTISPRVNINLLQSDFSNITRRLEQKNHSASLRPFINFQGQISVGEFLLPIQKFSLRQENKYLFIENFPMNSFPKIEIILEEKNSVYGVKDFKVRPSDDSVEGEILYTRFFLISGDIKKCSLHFRDIDFIPFDFVFSDITPEEKKQMIFRAKLFRKLRFIEKVLEKTKFIVPEYITPNEVGQIEVLFRGSTEGDFINPSDSSVTIYNYKVSKYDLENNFPFSKRQFFFQFNENFLH